jgi:hypothetical protein
MYERYGLNKNPFEWRDPLEEPAHFLTVEGFGEQKPIIDSAFKHVTRTHFVLIHGISGTGRTSVSNYVASVFAGDTDPLKVIHVVDDDFHTDSFHKWMEKFAFQAKYKGLKEIPGYFKEVGDRASATTMKYVDFLFSALAELKAQKRCLIAIFEDVKNQQLFETVREVFDPDVGQALPSLPLVIFTSSLDAISNAFGNLHPRPAGPDPIKLRTLNGNDVLTLVTEKWNKASKSPPQPFDSQAIVKFFEIQQYPLKRAIEALNSIFEEKLPDGDDWPANNGLAIATDEIAAALMRFQMKTQSR